MAKALSTLVSASVSWNHTNALTGSINITNANGMSYSKSTTDGTGAAGTADLIYAVQTTIAGGATSDFDLAGSLTDAFGSTITMARVKFLYIHLTTDTAATHITVGNDTNPVPFFSATTSTIVVRNGGIFLHGGTGATGIAVTASTGDVLQIVNSDGAVTATIDLCIIGSSA